MGGVAFPPLFDVLRVDSGVCQRNNTIIIKIQFIIGIDHAHGSLYQGRIELLKAARGHVTFYMAKLPYECLV